MLKTIGTVVKVTILRSILPITQDTKLRAELWSIAALLTAATSFLRDAGLAQLTKVFAGS